MGISREGWGLRDGTFPNKKKKHHQTRKKTPPNKKKKDHQTRKKDFQTRKKDQQTRKKTPTDKKKPFEQGKRLSSKGYLPIKCKSLQVVGVSGQGKAVVSDGG